MTNNAGGGGGSKSADKEYAPKKKVKGWKALVGGGQDHQFFNNKRLDELEAIEREREKFENNPEEYKDKEAPPEFTEEMAKEMEELLAEGFSSWNKRDFHKFINCCELHGRDNLEHFTELFALGKSLEEIQEYSESFWKNYKQIENYQKHIDRVEKGELEIERRNSIDRAIQDKFGLLMKQFKVRNPDGNLEDFTFLDVKIAYPKSYQPNLENPFEYTVDEDKLYAYCLFKYTYGYWELAKNELRNNPHFLYNWVAKMRSNIDI